MILTESVSSWVSTRLDSVDGESLLEEVIAIAGLWL